MRKKSDKLYAKIQECPKCGSNARLEVYIERWTVYKQKDGTIIHMIKKRATTHTYNICGECKILLDFVPKTSKKNKTKEI